jgi:glutamate/tyrosine decarboxylase-like PLP-dependent enzyme
MTASRLDQINEQVQAGVIEAGVAMLSSTRLRGVYSLRLCIMSHQTTWDDVQKTLEAIEEQGRALI